MPAEANIFWGRSSNGFAIDGNCYLIVRQPDSTGWRRNAITFHCGYQELAGSCVATDLVVY
jgi:hypothetical protein